MPCTRALIVQSLNIYATYLACTYALKYLPSFGYSPLVDTILTVLRPGGTKVLREPADMPWGERLAFVSDPEGNVVTLAVPAG